MIDKLQNWNGFFKSTRKENPKNWDGFVTTFLEISKGLKSKTQNSVHYFNLYCTDLKTYNLIKYTNG